MKVLLTFAFLQVALPSYIALVSASKGNEKLNHLQRRQGYGNNPQSESAGAYDISGSSDYNTDYLVPPQQPSYLQQPASFTPGLTTSTADTTAGSYGGDAAFGNSGTSDYNTNYLSPPQQPDYLQQPATVGDGIPTKQEIADWDDNYKELNFDTDDTTDIERILRQKSSIEQRQSKVPNNYGVLNRRAVKFTNRNNLQKRQADTLSAIRQTLKKRGLFDDTNGTTDTSGTSADEQNGPADTQ